MEDKLKALEKRVENLERMEERRQRNLHELVQNQIEREKRREKLKSTSC